MECCAGVKSLTGGAGHSHGSMPSNCTDWSSTTSSHLAGVVLVFSKLLLLSIRWAAARVKRERELGETFLSRSSGAAGRMVHRETLLNIFSN